MCVFNAGHKRNMLASEHVSFVASANKMKIYMCLICEKKFKLKGDFIRHINRKFLYKKQENTNINESETMEVLNSSIQECETYC